VALVPELADCWLKAPREWPDEAVPPGHRWAKLVLGEGAIEAVVKYLAKEFSDRVPLKFDLLLKKKDEAKVEILVAHLDTYAALLLRNASLEPRQLSLLAVASGLQAANPDGLEREKRRETWKARRDEAEEWAKYFLTEAQVKELYERGFY
jgi:hypothetical protein